MLSEAGTSRESVGIFRVQEVELDRNLQPILNRNVIGLDASRGVFLVSSIMLNSCYLELEWDS